MSFEISADATSGDEPVHFCKPGGAPIAKVTTLHRSGTMGDDVQPVPFGMPGGLHQDIDVFGANSFGGFRCPHSPQGDEAIAVSLGKIAKALDTRADSKQRREDRERKTAAVDLFKKRLQKLGHRMGKPLGSHDADAQPSSFTGPSRKGLTPYAGPFSGKRSLFVSQKKSLPLLSHSALLGCGHIAGEGVKIEQVAVGRSTQGPCGNGFLEGHGGLLKLP